MELRNPFGFRDGQIIMIEDVPKGQNGLRCNCVCPACKEPFEARMGEVRRHHFAHSGQGCDEINAYMAGLYMLLNEYLNSHYPLFLPPVIVGFELSAYYYLSDTNIEEHITLLSQSLNKEREEKLYDATIIKFQHAYIEENSKGKPITIIAERGESKLAVCITPPDTVCKTGKATKYKDYPTIEIDLSEAGDIIQNSHKKEIFQYLIKNTSIYKWIYNPKISKVYPKIINRSRAYYDSAQARMKKEEEERKAEIARRIEKMRKETEQRRLESEEMEKELNAEIIINKEMEKNTKEQEYAIGLSDVSNLFTHQTSIICDRYGNRWVKCKKCGVIKRDYEFGSYGGLNEVNLGICADCYKK